MSLENGTLKNSKWHVLVAMWLGQMFDAMDASIYVLVLYPALSELLKTASHSTVGVIGSIVLAVFMLGWACGGIVFGILSDYIGRTRTLVLTILLYAIATGLCAISHNWIELALYRFLVGCGIGGEIGIGVVILSEYWRGQSRLNAVGAMCTSFGCGYLVTALLNLWLGPLGWRYLFAAGVVPALLTVYIRAKLKEPPQFELSCQYRRHLKKKPRSMLTKEESQYVSHTFPEIFSRTNWRKTLLIVTLSTTATVAYWAVLSWIPAWINQLTGSAAVQQRSITAIVMNLGTIVSAALAGAIVISLGRARAFRLAFVGSLLCCIGMFVTVKTFAAPLLVWVFFVGAFAELAFVCLYIYAPEVFDVRIRGTAFGFSVQVGRVIAAMGALLSGQIIAICSGSYAIAGACMATVNLMGIVASFFVFKTSGILPDVEECATLEQRDLLTAD